MKEKIKKKILAISIILIIIIAMICVFYFKNNKAKENKQPAIDNSELAVNILQEVNMDSFIASYFTDSVELNKNLIDVSSVKSMSHYFVGNQDVERYVLLYENPHNIDMIYVKYNDFIKTIKKVFNSEPKYNYKSTAMVFPDLTKTQDGKYNTKLEGAHVCNLNTDTDDCLVLIAGGSIPNNKEAEFSALKMENNIITGNVKKYHDTTDRDFYIDGEFEFRYEKINDQYIAKSFIITKINAQ